MEKTIKELEKDVEELKANVAAILERLKTHESLQGQKETAIYDHIESVRRHGMDTKAANHIFRNKPKSESND